MITASLPALLISFVQILRLCRFVQDTTVTAALYWAVGALCSCSLTAVLRIFEAPVRYSSAVQYLSAGLLLTPWVALLGARRPGAKAWPWFVVLPLIIVLQWPAVSQLAGSQLDAAIAVPTPTMVGFVLVLVMGTGNYFGTLNTGAMLVSVVGILLIVAETAEAGSGLGAWSFTLGCWSLAVATFLMPGRFFERPEPSSEPAGVAQLWHDFRDLYGIVWAKRVMDRVNLFGHREGWASVLTLDGFVSRSSDGRPSADTVSPDQRAVQILCWVLKRFVDRRFLRRYLPEEKLARDIDDKQS